MVRRSGRAVLLGVRYRPEDACGEQVACGTGSGIAMTVRERLQPIEHSGPSAAEQATLPCPLAHLCLNGLRCRTRTFLVCERHEPPLYICPIKNRGRACPACGAWIARVVPALNGEIGNGTKRR